MNTTLPAATPSPGDVDPVPCPSEEPHDMHPWTADGDRPELCAGVLPPPAAGGRHRRAVVGCVGCREIGPLLTAPGTSGRDWQCESCGTIWPGGAGATS